MDGHTQDTFFEGALVLKRAGVRSSSLPLPLRLTASPYIEPHFRY